MELSRHLDLSAEKRKRVTTEPGIEEEKGIVAEHWMAMAAAGNLDAERE